LAGVRQHNSTIVSTFADDAAVLSRHTDLNVTIANLQTHLNSIEKWTHKWRLRIKVRPHRTRSAAADCGLCPLRNVTF